VVTDLTLDKTMLREALEKEPWKRAFLLERQHAHHASRQALTGKLR
jgi:hypothetical protein